MSVQETPTELWGGETTKAVANFPVSGERVPLPVVRWLGRIKGTAARVNAELGLLDAELAERIAAAEPVSPLRTFMGRPGHVRRSWGPGWALVGDAGYYKDPVSAHGITDALRDAELVARAAVDGGFTAQGL